MYRIIQGDALEELKKLSDKSIDFIVTDPPYGIGVDKKMFAKRNQKYGRAAARKHDYGETDWDNSIPSQEVFEQIFRVSKNQIIFGGNYFTEFLPPSRCWIAWDKKTDEKYNNHFADIELIWTSFDKPSRVCRFLWHGMIQGDMKNKEKRYHPTQKPVHVMRWLIERYVTGDHVSILDPFMGVGSTLLAAQQLGLDCIGVEKEHKYIEIAKERLEAQNVIPTR